MTTTAAMPLPNVASPRPTQDSGEHARPSRSRDSENTECPKTDFSDTETPSNVQSRSAEGRDSFAETLKKRLKKEDADVEKSQKGKHDDGSSSAAVHIPAEPQVQSKTPVVIKTIAHNPARQEKTAEKQLLNTAVRLAEPKSSSTQKSAEGSAEKVLPAQTINTKAAEKPVVETPSQKTELVPESDAKTQSKFTVPATEKQATIEKNTAENGDSIPQKGAEPRAVSLNRTIENTVKNPDAKPVEPSKTADTHNRDNSTHIQRPENIPRLAALASSNNSTGENKLTDEKTDSSLKQTGVHFIRPSGDKKGVAEIQSADAKMTQTMNLKENSTTAADSVKVVGSVESSVSPASAASSASQVESIKGVGDIAAVRPIDQIVQTLQLRTFGAESQIRMSLVPEELGAIRITFRQIDNQVVGLLEVRNTETRKEIERSIGQLTAAMENAGVQVRRIEVVPWNNNSQNSRGEQFTQDFDARSRQEMYQSNDGEAAHRQSRKGFQENSELQTAAAASQKSETTLSETGLNFFI